MGWGVLGASFTEVGLHAPFGERFIVRGEQNLADDRLCYSYSYARRHSIHGCKLLFHKYRGLGLNACFFFFFFTRVLFPEPP